MLTLEASNFRPERKETAIAEHEPFPKWWRWSWVPILVNTPAVKAHQTDDLRRHGRGARQRRQTSRLPCSRWSQTLRRASAAACRDTARSASSSLGGAKQELRTSPDAAHGPVIALRHADAGRRRGGVNAR